MYQIIGNISAVYNERTAIILGLTTLLLGLAVFFSCRTFLSLYMRLHLGNPLSNKGYLGFYRYHLFYWWIFGVALVSHFMMGVIHTGLPAAVDVDAYIHWIILVFGFMTALSSLTIFSTCRVYPRLLAPDNKYALSNRVYRTIYRSHSYYWIGFIVLFSAHFATSYIHAGMWPTVP